MKDVFHNRTLQCIGLLVCLIIIGLIVGVVVGFGGIRNDNSSVLLSQTKTHINDRTAAMQPTRGDHPDQSPPKST